MHAGEDLKKRLLLADKHEEEFWITAAQSAPPQHNENAEVLPPPADSSSSFCAKNVAAWASSTGSRCTDGEAPSLPKGFGEEGGGLEKILDALSAVGMRGDETDALLRGLSAVLHLGQVTP